MRRYTRDDVDLHNDGGIGGPYYPAVKVKVYGGWPYPEQVVKHFGCSEAQAEQALEWAWDSAVSLFWENAQVLADDMLKSHFGEVEAFSAGRMGGWLVVAGLPDVETWDAISLAKWRSFERAIRADVEDRCNWESVKPLLACALEGEG